MRMIEILETKRDGGILDDEAIEFVARGAARGDIPDYQLAAWLMACFIHGLNSDETAALIRAMLHSGAVLDLSDMPCYKIDKHSTGGVGDKVSLIAAPVCASFGLSVPMISGRGLGHTGGTLDKLESIPGFRTRLSLDDFRRTLKQCGMGLIGQTDEIAPADRVLYALRDVTATVPHPSLIAASILSKKLAEGLDGLVMDVKCGKAAFMPRIEQARHLARIIVEAARAMGKGAAAVITSMDQPLGRAAGNAVEVAEAIRVLRGEALDSCPDLLKVCETVTGRMLAMGGVATDAAEGADLTRAALADGSAAEAFARVIEAQGGDPRVVDDPGRLPRPARTHALPAVRAGVAAQCDGLSIGRGLVALGAGRERKEDPADPACGVILHAKIGERVEPGEPLATIHYNDEARLAAALPCFEDAFALADEAPAPGTMILAEIV